MISVQLAGLNSTKGLEEEEEMEEEEELEEVEEEGEVEGQIIQSIAAEKPWRGGCPWRQIFKMTG